MADSARELLLAFDRALWQTAAAAKSLKPSMPATAFRRMLTDYGGKSTADRLLQKDQPSDGFNDLYFRGKENLRLSVEYVVLSNPWRQLFTPEQLRIARQRLVNIECELPAEDLEAALHVLGAAIKPPPRVERVVVHEGSDVVAGAHQCFRQM